MKISLLTLTTAAFLISSLGIAQPTINNTSGAFQHGQTVTINGSAFSTKSSAKPYLWDDLSSPAYSGLSHGDNVPTQQGTYGAPKDVNAPWSTQGSPWSNPVTYNTTNTRVANSPCYRANNKGYLKGKDSGGSEVPKMYVTWWVNFSHNINSGPGGTASTKLIRVWDSGGDNARLSWTGMHMTYKGMPSSSWKNWGGTYGQWSRVEVFIDNEAHTIQTFTDGKIIHNISDLGTDTSNYLNWIALIGLDPSVTDNLDSNLTADFGDIYADSVFARVELGNASTWAACTHKEIQIPSAWSSTDISITVNQGSFNDCDQVYLYVVDKDGKMNSNGYPVTISGSGCVSGIEGNMETSIQIYPNPTSGILNIEGISATDQITLTLTNILGEEVKVNHERFSNKMVIKTEQLPTGVYLLNITCNNQKTVYKIIKRD